MSVIAYIGLGSNLGDRRQLLERAVAELKNQPGIESIRVSDFIETDPVGGPPDQGKYLNAAAEMKATLSACELLRVLQDVENRLGRVRREPHGPRTIDLDLLLYGNEVIDSPELQVPHPRMLERLFVLRPLAAIAPLAVHPLKGSTVKDLLYRLEQSSNQSWRATQQELRGHRALVTGSTSGIGRAIALELAAAGAEVLVHGRRENSAKDVTAACQTCGARSAYLLADFADADLDSFAERAWNFWHGLDICVCNAGADTLTGAAALWPFEQKLAALWKVDVEGAILLARAIGQRMKQAGHGVVLTMGWDQAETGMEGDSGQLFAATKGAVMAFSKSLARTLAPEVRVNCLAPGWIRTAWGNQASSTWQDRVMRETPLERWGTPEDVARAARWLVSPAAAFVTGQVLRINGGAVSG